MKNMVGVDKIYDKGTLVGKIYIPVYIVDLSYHQIAIWLITLIIPSLTRLFIIIYAYLLKIKTTPGFTYRFLQLDKISNTQSDLNLATWLVAGTTPKLQMAGSLL